VEFHHDEGAVEEFRRLILGRLADLEPVNISCVLTRRYLLDFAILYESLVESWTFYPFRVHAFVFQPDVAERLEAANFEHAEIHLLEDDPGTFPKYSATRVRLIEESGLERSIVADVDNVFLAETPELFMLLSEFDLVFVASPKERWLIEAGLWAYRDNERTRRFARLWHSHSIGRRHAEMSGLPFALLENADDGLKIKVLAKPKPDSQEHHLSPYNIQANVRPFVLTTDALGFREHQMGRAKVVHLAGMRARGARSVSKRLDVVMERYPALSDFISLYGRLANAGARRLGMETLSDVDAYLDERMNGNQER
jgi:hypothetical protein